MCIQVQTTQTVGNRIVKIIGEGWLAGVFWNFLHGM